MLGGGVLYRFTDNFNLRGEVEHIAIDKKARAGDITTVTANAAFSF
jgi:hypothetical protein